MHSHWNENQIHLRGRLTEVPRVSHINHDTTYCLLPLVVRRLSGAEDRLHVVAARPLLEGLTLEPGAPLGVRGEVRTFNNRSGVGSKLVVSVFAKALSQAEGAEDENRLELAGTLCKPPALRSTPPGPDHLRHDSGGEPPVRPGGLSPLHRLGEPGPPVRGHGSGRPPPSGRPAPEPGLHQGDRRAAPGAHRLRGVHYVPSAPGALARGRCTERRAFRNV